MGMASLPSAQDRNIHVGHRVSHPIDTGSFFHHKIVDFTKIFFSGQVICIINDLIVVQNHEIK